MATTHLLLLHGNGGAETRFLPMLKLWPDYFPDIEIHIPRLSGFGGRPLAPADDYWEVFLREMGECVIEAGEGDWVLYGHGIGGSPFHQ